LSLTPEQSEILVGHLLGDGNLDKQGNRRPMFRLAYKVASKPYLEFLESKFGLLIRTGVRLRKFGRYGLRAVLNTRRLKALELPFASWYTPKKRLPEVLQLTPLVITTWFQDDGSKTKGGYVLCSESFTKEENIRLAALLTDFLDAAVNVVRTNSGTGYRLYIGAKSGAKSKFTEVVRPLMHPVFKYKLHVSVETERNWDGNKTIQDTVHTEAFTSVGSCSRGACRSLAAIA
jgi:hypothetical protein